MADVATMESLTYPAAYFPYIQIFHDLYCRSINSDSKFKKPKLANEIRGLEPFQKPKHPTWPLFVSLLLPKCVAA
jgi:hypothetical protein